MHHRIGVWKLNITWKTVNKKLTEYKHIKPYVFYFAISQSERGQGYGSYILQTVKEFYKNQRLCLAIEEIDETAANYQQWVKRKEFYEKNGFTDLHCKLRKGKSFKKLCLLKLFSSTAFFN